MATQTRGLSETADRKAVGRSYVDRSPALEEVICNFTSPKALSLRRQPGTYSCHNGRDEAHHVLRAPSALQHWCAARLHHLPGALFYYAKLELARPSFRAVS